MPDSTFPPIFPDAVAYAKGARPKGRLANPAHAQRIAPPPNWTPPPSPAVYDEFAAQFGPSDPNDVAGWQRYLNEWEERAAATGRKNPYALFRWRPKDGKPARRELLLFAASMGFDRGLCKALGLIPIRQRCGAWARQAGRPCRNWGLANGRCRFHGGRAGAPRGNTNALKNGSINGEAAS